MRPALITAASLALVLAAGTAAAAINANVLTPGAAIENGPVVLAGTSSSADDSGSVPEVEVSRSPATMTTADPGRSGEPGDDSTRTGSGGDDATPDDGVTSASRGGERTGTQARTSGSASSRSSSRPATRTSTRTSDDDDRSSSSSTRTRTSDDDSRSTRSSDSSGSGSTKTSKPDDD